MSLKEIIQYGGGGLILLLTLIQITPIKINPWSWLLKTLGNALNADIKKEIEKTANIEKEDRQYIINRLDEVERLQNEFKEDKLRSEALAARRDILRFADELRAGQGHSEELFNDVLEDISDYERYCEEHPLFKNRKATAAIKFVSDTYDDCLRNNSFL